MDEIQSILERGFHNITEVHQSSYNTAQ